METGKTNGCCAVKRPGAVLHDNPRNPTASGASHDGWHNISILRSLTPLIDPPRRRLRIRCPAPTQVGRDLLHGSTLQNLDGLSLSFDGLRLEVNQPVL
jgi:hypothetical protein